MSLNKTFIDKAEVTWQFKANDQEKLFIGKLTFSARLGTAGKGY